MAKELTQALADYCVSIRLMDIYVDYKCIVGYRYINDSNCELRAGCTRCYILGIYVLHGCKVLFNGRKLEQYMVFNKTILDIPFPLYRIELDE